MKFSGKVRNGPLNKRLNFGGDPDRSLDTWFVFRIRHYWNWEIRKVVNGHKSAAHTDLPDECYTTWTFYYKFTAESDSEWMLRNSQHLEKLRAWVEWQLVDSQWTITLQCFLPPCMYVCVCVSPPVDGQSAQDALRVSSCWCGRVLERASFVIWLYRARPALVCSTASCLEPLHIVYVYTNWTKSIHKMQYIRYSVFFFACVRTLHLLKYAFFMMWNSDSWKILRKARKHNVKFIVDIDREPQKEPTYYGRPME